MMTANFHTHTVRCKHAWGEDREYVKAAIKSGIKVLGFSDHTPYLGFYDGHAMDPEEISDYCLSITSLKEEFKNKIEIHLGLEVEYYPEFFGRTFDLIKQYPIEYMILGQHSYDYNTMYSTGITEYDDCVKFVDRCCEAMKTGLFAYIAHPDIFGLDRNDPRYPDLMGKICETAKECNMPVEINLLGLATGRIYPCEAFLKIAGELKNDVIIGRDAHSPEVFSDKETEKRAYDFCDKFNLNLVDTIDFTRLK